MANARIPPFAPDVLQGIADVLGATAGGLTGTEIAQTLGQVRVPDVDPTTTKRHRLFNALAFAKTETGTATALGDRCCRAREWCR